MKDPSEQLHVGIIGGGLGGLITAMDLAEAGHKVCMDTYMYDAAV